MKSITANSKPEYKRYRAVEVIIADHFNIPLSILRSKTRKREVMEARHIVKFLGRKYFKSLSTADLGALFDHDHATVLNSIKVVNNLSETDKRIKTEIQELEKKINDKLSCPHFNFVRVILESPYAGEVERNINYAKLCLKDSLLRGEAPIASHLLYTQKGILDDTIPQERSLGINAGLAWKSVADKHVFYVDYGYSEGMQYAKKYATDNEILIEERKIL
jgi:hypothetical protein